MDYSNQAITHIVRTTKLLEDVVRNRWHWLCHVRTATGQIGVCSNVKPKAQMSPRHTNSKLEKNCNDLKMLSITWNNTPEAAEDWDRWCHQVAPWTRQGHSQTVWTLNHQIQLKTVITKLCILQEHKLACYHSWH